MGDSIIEHLDDRFANIKEAERRSREIIDRLKSLNDRYRGTGTFLVATGSLARRETVPGSDFDSFVVQGKSDRASAEEIFDEAYRASGLTVPGTSETFGLGVVEEFDSFVTNIGGDDDLNRKLTRRMLFILESISIGDQEMASRLLDAVVGRYISEKITDHQLGMFLLNDIIRFYRTMCVDFEYKTVEGGKPWGIRNIKLVFSRKIIYFSGLVMCAEIAQKTPKQKKERIIELVRMTPLERIVCVLRARAHQPLVRYNQFLKNISDEDVRNLLKNEPEERLRGSEVFRAIKNDGHHFSWALRSAFNRHYDSTHPIHKAIMF